MPDGRPAGAAADAIATRALLPAAFCWRSTVHVSPPPLTDVSVRVECVHDTNTKTRAPVTAAPFVVRVMVLLFALSLFVPRLLSNAIAVVLPVPDRDTDRGLPNASSESCRLPVRVPAADGENVRPIVQLAAGASVAGDKGHVVVCEKSPTLVPTRPMLLIDKGAVPVFVTLTVAEALVVPTRCDPKVTDVGDSVTAGAVPLPESATLCGLPAASSLTLTLALRFPLAVGTNLTLIVQVALTASDPGQSFDCVKSPGFVPAMAMPVMVSGAVPVFLSVDDWDALVDPTSCEPKARLAGVNVTAGAGVVPVPPSVTL